MAALRVSEDTMTGRITLSAAWQSRLGGVLGGMVWLAVVIAFVLISNGGEMDWVTLIIIGVFVLLPIASSLLGALIATTFTLDRGTRSLTLTREFIGIPISRSSTSFSNLANLQVQFVRAGSKTRATKGWLLNAVTRDGKSVFLNWQGTQSEITDLAQKISTLTGVPWLESPAKLPPVVAGVLEKIAPEEMNELKQIEDATPTAPPADAPAPVANELQALFAPTPITESAPSTPAPTANDDVRALSLDALEQRIAADKMDSTARYALARKYHARGQVDRAMALYQETLRIEPAHTGAQNDLGVALQARGKRTEAEAAYRRAIALDPFAFVAHLNLALLLRSVNRAVEASTEFYQARQNARGDAETRMAEAASSGNRMEPQLSKT